MPILWHNKEDDRMVSSKSQGKGKFCIMDRVLEEKVNKFCMLNHPCMEKWVTMHEEEQNIISQQRKEYRGTLPNTSSFQYLPYLKETPNFITIDWLHKALQATNLREEHVTKIEREFAR